MIKWFKGTSNKKYKVILFDKNNKKIKTIQFGDKRYKHYKDITPLKLYTHLNHNDKERRKLYYKRHKINYPKYTPDYFSKRYLW